MSLSRLLRFRVKRAANWRVEVLPAGRGEPWETLIDVAHRLRWEATGKGHDEV